MHSLRQLPTVWAYLNHNHNTMTHELSAKSKEFLSRGPYRMGHYQGADIYEHPELGEEGQMIAIYKGKKLLMAHHFEMSDLRLHGFEACLACKQ